MVRIQVHHHGDHVVEILGLFAVADNLFVIDVMEAQAPIALQRGFSLRMRLTRAMKSLRLSALSRSQCLDLVFFRVEIFFAARLARADASSSSKAGP